MIKPLTSPLTSDFLSKQWLHFIINSNLSHFLLVYVSCKFICVSVSLFLSVPYRLIWPVFVAYLVIFTFDKTTILNIR